MILFSKYPQFQVYSWDCQFDYQNIPNSTHSTWAQNIFERIDQDYETESITAVLLLACFFAFGEWHSLKSLSKKKSLKNKAETP